MKQQKRNEWYWNLFLLFFMFISLVASFALLKYDELQYKYAELEQDYKLCQLSEMYCRGSEPIMEKVPLYIELNADGTFGHTLYTNISLLNSSTKARQTFK